MHYLLESPLASFSSSGAVLSLLDLGSARLFSLSEACARARKARQQIADGVDPLESRRAEGNAQRLASSFAEAAKGYFRDA